MNTFKKYCPNVFVAQCEEKQETGATATLTSKYGKETEVEIINFLGKSQDKFMYSFIRLDGFNSQERAKAKVEKIRGYQVNATKRSNEAYEGRATKHELEFLSLGEPIKVGHHSEKRHRKLFERYDNKMRKSIEENDKANSYESRAKYWEGKINNIDLSMPESLDYFEFKLEQAKKKHAILKDDPAKRSHSYSLTYANKDVKELTKKVHLAIKLWGSEEENNLIEKEKTELAEKKARKNGKFDNLLEQYGGFFFFGSDADSFKAKHTALINSGYIDEGEKVCHITAGLYIPLKHKDAFISNM
jgi:hypothetical protein